MSEDEFNFEPSRLILLFNPLYILVKKQRNERFYTHPHTQFIKILIHQLRGDFFDNREIELRSLITINEIRLNEKLHIDFNENKKRL